MNSVEHTPAGIEIQKAMLSATLVLDIPENMTGLDSSYAKFSSYAARSIVNP